MKLRAYTTITVATLVAALGLGLAQAQASSAAVSYATLDAPGDAVVGHAYPAAAFVYKQKNGDCEEGSVNIVLGAITGHRVSAASIQRKALALGVGIPARTASGKVIPGAVNGSNWLGPNGVVKLLAHYHLKATVGTHKIATVETALAKGYHVIAFVNAETLWATQPTDRMWGPPPAGMGWVPVTPGTNPDHAVVLDSINKTAKTATVSDTGTGYTYTVPLHTFELAVKTSGRSYAVITTKHTK